jgi:hypothetical protein
MTTPSRPPWQATEPAPERVILATGDGDGHYTIVATPEQIEAFVAPFFTSDYWRRLCADHPIPTQARPDGGR